ncbi:tetratricopeptide repeat protein [Streptomyces sp. NPDC002685]|uniref:tetratricopeptide repeat protein n=1 Tax=Streptomyces sp. NPDC002685 TaxID=3154540 RepID=UPI00331DFB9B
MSTRYELAYWRGESGDATGAVAGFEELLPDLARILGPDHPHTLTTRHALAAWRGRGGDTAGAVAGFEELLPDRVRILGPDHPHTMSTRYELAVWRREARSRRRSQLLDKRCLGRARDSKTADGL